MLEFAEELDDESYRKLLREAYKKQNVSEIIEKLYLLDRNLAKEAVAILSNYIALSNEMAYEGLLKYYNELSSALDLDDVHFRIEIVKELSYKKYEPSTIDAYVNELIRTPSNNTTRKLYYEILDLLAICSIELIEEPLTNLLEKRQYAYKMERRILNILEGVEDDESRILYIKYLRCSSIKGIDQKLRLFWKQLLRFVAQ